MNDINFEIQQQQQCRPPFFMRVSARVRHDDDGDDDDRLDIVTGTYYLEAQTRFILERTNGRDTAKEARTATLTFCLAYHNLPRSMTAVGRRVATPLKMAVYTSYGHAGKNAPYSPILGVG